MRGARPMRRGGVLGAAALCSLLAAPALAATEVIDIGRTTVVVRTVTGTLATQVRKLLINEDVRQSEVIATAPDAASEIQFVDGTKITIGPNARVTLDKFVYDPDPSKGAFFINLAEGVFRFVTGSMAHQSYSIQTPSGTIGVRGTTINVDSIVDVDGQKTIVCVDSGHAFGRALSGTIKDYFAGDCFTVTPRDVRNSTTGEVQRNVRDVALTDVTILAGLNPQAGPGNRPGPLQNFAVPQSPGLGNCISKSAPGGSCTVP